MDWETFIKFFSKLYKHPNIRKAAGKLDAKDMYVTANTFFNGAEIIVNASGRKKDGTIYAPLLPVVTNLAFSLELYLKTLLTLQGMELPKGRGVHEVSKLFRDLEEENKSSIMDEYEALIDSDFDSQGRFSSELECLDRVFIDWRYIYEKENLMSVNFKYLANITFAVRSVVRNLRPEWD